MAPSYRSTDYRLRPSKYAERAMLCEALGRLQFHNLEDYQYVGLGSIFFTDFRMVQRALGISRMVSIEQNAVDYRRFIFNMPFNGIRMLFGSTESKLAEIDFSHPTILWLDYDSRLSRSIINDVRMVAREAIHGMAFVVTVNAHPSENALEEIQEELGKELVSPSINADELYGWGRAGLYRKIFDGQIREVLSVANEYRAADQKIEYEQLFNFQYSDGARMATFGGVFFEAAKRSEFQKCAFERLRYYRNGDTHCRIEVPVLTQRERWHLDRQLPLPENSAIRSGPMPKKDAAQYAEFYRYLPTFLPVEQL